MNDHDECIKAIRKFHEDVIKGYMEKPNQKLDKSIRELTDEEFFLLSMLVLFDIEGDAISRQAVIEYIEGSEAELAHSSENELVCQDIKKMPPVVPQQRTGKWIDNKCSVCGKGIEDLIESSEWYRNEDPNFCPFCGIKLLIPQAESEE